MNIIKGTHIRASWLKPNIPLSSLAGMQTKLGCTQVNVSGIVRHIRVNDPLHPTDYQLYIDLDFNDPNIPTVQLVGCTCGRKHVQVDPKHITG
jgi:hypothetical protein